MIQFLRAIPQVLLFGLLLALPGVGAARGGPSEVLAEARREGRMPAVQACILVDGRVAWQAALGYADLQARRPVTGDTPFRLASCTKTMVATAVLQLVDRGKLRLDVRLPEVLPSKVLEGLPGARDITVRMLLNHTSGLEDYLDEIVDEAALAEPTREWSDLQVLEFARGLDPVGRPGQRHSYSNTGYLLLGVVLEKAGGASVGSQLRERIFRPLGMARTYYGPHRSAPRDVAHGYDERGEDVSSVNLGDGLADGGAIAPAHDLALFLDGLMRGRLLKPATLKLMKTTVPDGEGGAYGLGLATDGAGKAWGHDGKIDGYLSSMVSWPGHEVTVAVVTSSTSQASEEAFEGLDVDLAEALEDR